MDPTPKTSNNTIIVYAGMGLSVVAVIILIILGISLLNINKPISVEVTPTPTPSTTTETPTPTPQNINAKAKIYMVVADSKDSSGAVWHVNPKDQAREPLIATNTIKQIIGFSEKNSYLAYVDSDANLVVMDMADRSVKRTYLKDKIKQDYVWNNDNELAIIDFEQNEKLKITKLTLPGLTVTEVSFLGKFNTAEVISNTNQVDLIFKNTLNEFNYKYQTEQKMMSEIVDPMWMPQLWVSENEFLFSAKEGLYIYNKTLNNFRQIMSIRSTENEPFGSTNFVLNGNSIYFVLEKELYKYSLDTKVTRTLADFADYLGSGDLTTLQITPDEAYLTVTINEKTYLYTVKDSSIKALCENYCGDIAIER